MSAVDNILDVRELRKSFNGRQVLESVSFAVSPGELVCLTGSNGSGKTTLLNIIGGFTRPEAGHVFLNSTDLIGMKPNRIAQLGVSRSFQWPRVADYLSVKDNLLVCQEPVLVPIGRPREIARNLLGGYSRSSTERVMSLLDRLRIRELANSSAGTLSYGQRKLLALACAVARNYQILLLDEPLAGLAEGYRPIVKELLCDSAQRGAAVLFVEHDLKSFSFASRVIVLRNGMVSFDKRGDNIGDCGKSAVKER